MTDPRKRPNGTYLPKGQRPPAPPLLKEAIAAGLAHLAFALFQQAFVEAKVKERERAAGIDPDRPGDAPVDWAELERTLGKEAVDRMRRGGG